MYRITEEILEKMRLFGLEKYPFSREELTKKYHKLSKKYHPDVTKDIQNIEFYKKITYIKKELEKIAIENDNSCKIIDISNYKIYEKKLKRKCEYCFDGTGMVYPKCTCLNGLIIDRFGKYASCPICKGVGVLIDKWYLCPHCEGKGET